MVSHGNPVTTSDYLLYFAREGLNQLRERTGEIHCVVTIVADIQFPSKCNSFTKRLREIRFPPVEQIVRSVEKGDVFQEGKDEGEERVLFVSSPIRSLPDVESQVRFLSETNCRYTSECTGCIWCNQGRKCVG